MFFRYIIIAFALLIVLFFAIDSFACGEEGPCPGVEDKGHGHAQLKIMNITGGPTVEIPGNIGLRPVMTANGKSSFCYDAVHTHGNDGTIHFQIGGDNPSTLGMFLTKWGRTDLLLNARVTVDDQPLTTSPMELILQPEMEIEIFFHGPPPSK